MSNDSTGIEELAEDECWNRLRQAVVARLAVWVEDHPEIFPLNYVVDRGSIVFRTGEGTKAAAALSENRVALEVDGLETGGPGTTGAEETEAEAADTETTYGAGTGQTAGAGTGTTYAWSVVVKGQVEQITKTQELMDTVGLPLTPWQLGPKGKFMRVRAHEVTGRRFPVASPEDWRNSFSDTRRAADE